MSYARPLLLIYLLGVLDPKAMSKRTTGDISDSETARKMRVNKKTKYATNGEVIIKLGWYAPGSHPEKLHSGMFYDCTCYPPESVRDLYNGGGHQVPEMWICGKDPFFKGFIEIKEHLIAADVLAILKTPLTR